MQNWPNESAVWLLQGNAHIAMAWDTRGGGYASTVTEEGWRAFRQHLAVTEKSLKFEEMLRLARGHAGTEKPAEQR